VTNAGLKVAVFSVIRRGFVRMAAQGLTARTLTVHGPQLKEEKADPSLRSG
jgi:hypothetical protein